MIIGHRGASGHAPENSLEAFRLCVDNPPTRCDGVELDIHTTVDGDFVVHHDFHLHDGQRIAELSTANVREVITPAGHQIPTLQASLEVLSGLEVYIEAKALPAEADARLVELIRRQPHPERLHVHAFDHRTIRRLHQRAPELSLGVLSSSYPLDPVSQVLMAGARTLWQEWHLIDEPLVAMCRGAGVEVIAWTVNEAAVAARLAGIGVAGLCGNFPERLVVGHGS
jgi:glycerophosphoryl diester phosphodiesterase